MISRNQLLRFSIYFFFIFIIELAFVAFDAEGFIMVDTLISRYDNPLVRRIYRQTNLPSTKREHQQRSQAYTLCSSTNNSRMEPDDEFCLDSAKILAYQGERNSIYASNDYFEAATIILSAKESIDRERRKRTDRNVGGYDPSERIGSTKEINVGDPQVKLQEKEFSVTSILRELAAIQQKGPQKYCILGTRHCSYLHQQIIELLAYALVLSGNHVYTSGAGGTNAATVRGALRAERPELLTVVLPQSMSKQPEESQKLLKQVEDIIEMPQNDELSLDVASRICNSYLLSKTDQLISFAFHESTTVIEATKEAKKLDMLVTVLYLD